MPAQSQLRVARDFAERFARHEKPATLQQGQPPDELEEYIHPERFLNPIDAPIDERESVDWVKARMSMPVALLRPEDCPDGFTWRMLIESRKDPNKFIKDICVKLAKPATDDPEERDGSSHDLSIMEALDRVDQAMRAEGVE